jgi:hypothetical protein
MGTGERREVTVHQVEATFEDGAALSMSIV